MKAKIKIGLSPIQIEKRIEKIKRELLEIGEMRPGRLSKQYNVCGNPTCKCKDPKAPQKHGPYNQLSYVRRGKSTSRFIRDAYLKEVQKQVDQYQQWKELTDEWLKLAIEHAEIKLKASRDTEKEPKN